VVVKSKIGRRRYIIAIRSENMKSAIEECSAIDSWCRVVLRKDKYVLLRCRHWHKDRIIEILNRHGIKTLRTTGTIKKAKRLMEGSHS
jgi:RNase P/RNase MRP subunit POP5